MNEIPFTLDQVGTVGLCVFIVLAIIRGWLVTKREALSYREDRDAWKQAYENSTKVNLVRDRQFKELLEGSKTSRAFLEGLQKAVDRK